MNSHIHIFILLVVRLNKVTALRHIHPSGHQLMLYTVENTHNIHKYSKYNHNNIKSANLRQQMVVLPSP